MFTNSVPSVTTNRYGGSRYNNDIILSFVISATLSIAKAVESTLCLIIFFEIFCIEYTWLAMFTKTVPSVTIPISLVYLHNFVFGHNIPWIETNYRILDIENTFIPHKLDYWYLFKVISHCPVRYALSRPLPILDMMKNIAFFGYIINHVCYLGILVCEFGFILVLKSLNLLKLFMGGWEHPI